MSTHADAQTAAGQIMRDAELKEARRMLTAARFTDLACVPGAHVMHRTADFYDLVMLYSDGHAEGIRQVLPDEDPARQTQLWFPGKDGPESAEAPPVWIKSGGPVEIVQELLSLG